MHGLPEDGAARADRAGQERLGQVLEVERAVRESRRGRCFRKPHQLEVVEREPLPGEKRLEDVLDEGERRGGDPRPLELVGAVGVPVGETPGGRRGPPNARPGLEVALVGDDPERRAPGDGVEVGDLEHPRPDVELAADERRRTSLAPVRGTSSTSSPWSRK